MLEIAGVESAGWASVSAGLNIGAGPSAKPYL
jgi:hypothetical protein